MVLSTVSWINSIGGDWNTASNWSTGVTPGAGDDVQINTAGITITHSQAVAESVHSLSSQAAINWESGSLTVASASTVSGAFNNAGVVSVQGGTLSLVGGGVSGGSFAVAAGAGLTFGGSTTLETSSQVTADGAVAFSGSAQVQGGYAVSVSGSTGMGGDVDFSGTVTGVGSALAVEGSADFHGTALAVADLTLGGAFLDTGNHLSAGDISVSDRFDWYGGTVGGPGAALTVAPGATLTLSNPSGGSGTFWQLDGRSLDNYGTATLAEGGPGGATHTLLLSGGAAVNNYGTFQVPSFGMDPGIVGSGTGEAVNNYGTFAADGTADTRLPVTATFNNSGSVSVQGGTLSLARGYLQTAGSTTLAGGALSGELSIQGGVLTGSGTIAGDVTNGGGHVAPGGPGAAGVLTVTGNYTQTAGGALDVDLGPGAAGVGYDQLQVGGTATLGGTLNANLLSAIADLCGDSFRVLTFAAQSGDFAAEQGLTLANGLVINPVYDATGLNLAVPQVGTAVAITASADPSLVNQSVTFTATVTPVLSGIETPTGTVQFQIDGANAGGPVTLVNGSASFTTSTLSAGNHTVTVVYGGDGDCLLGSSGSLVQAVHYSFSGFLPPLSQNVAFATGRTIPVKLQLSDANGNLITSLSAISSLTVQALDGNGNPIGSPTNLLATGGTSLTNSGGQYLFNWNTRGLAAGSYILTANLADGTAHSKTLSLVNGSVGSAGLVSDGSSTITPVVGALLGGDVELYVDNSNGDLTPDELARINDAVAAVDSTLAAYGVTINEVSDPTQANATLSMDSTSAAGGMADGVLGCTTDSGQVTLIQGWNYYAGSDPSQINASQYDFQTVVTHELGHVLGLGHSTDSTSVMYASLDPGTAKHSLSVQDLNVADTDSSTCGLHVAGSAASGQGASSVSLPGGLAGLLTRLETLLQATGAVPAGSISAGSDAAFIAAMQQIEAEVQSARWKSWGDVYSLLQSEEQAVLADLFALQDAFSTSVDHRRS